MMSESEDSLVDSAKKERHHYQHLREYHARVRLDSMTDSGTDTETRERDIMQVRIIFKLIDSRTFAELMYLGNH